MVHLVTFVTHAIASRAGARVGDFLCCLLCRPKGKRWIACATIWSEEGDNPPVGLYTQSVSALVCAKDARAFCPSELARPSALANVGSFIAGRCVFCSSRIPVIIYIVEPCTIDVEEPTNNRRKATTGSFVCGVVWMCMQIKWLYIGRFSAKTSLTKTVYIFPLPTYRPAQYPLISYIDAFRYMHA